MRRMILAVLVYGSLFPVPSVTAGEVAPSNELFRKKIQDYLTNFWVTQHSNPRFARKSATLNALKVGHAEPFQAARHGTLRDVRWGSPVYPVKVEFTLVARDGQNA